MRILVLTFYYEPDLCAGSFRATAFVKALAETLPDTARIDVFTTLPNRYQSFSAAAPEREEQAGVSIRRIALPPHQSGMADQARAFSTFARQVLKDIRGQQYDLVFATSSRLFTAALGAYCARRVRAPLYLDIRDIFNDTIGDVLKGRAIRLLMPMLNSVERYTVCTADGVNLVSEGFRDYFEHRYPGRLFSVIPNGIDEDFLTALPTPAEKPEHGPRRVVYAGNIGQGQGLHRVLPELAAQAGEAFEFLVLGDGGARGLLEQSLAERQVRNVRLVPPVERKALLEYYAAADVLFLHLNDLPAFRRVLPSKIFEYAAIGKPILAGVAGYAANFLCEQVGNAAVFPPCDAAAGVQALTALTYETTDRSGFVSRYRRDALTRTLAADVLARTGIKGRG